MTAREADGVGVAASGGGDDDKRRCIVLSLYFVK